MEFVKANELRIGNIVFNIGDYITIKSIDDRGINREEDDLAYAQCRSYHCSLPGPVGVPLTDKMLLEIGFKKLSLHGLYDIGADFEIEACDEEAGTYRMSINGGEYNFGKEFKSLHELQNLFFGITGEELPIKEVAVFA